MRIAVAMSGGVDSSVAAALLKQDGHEIYGVTMNLNLSERLPRTEGKQGCFTESNAGAVEKAARVCDFLGIPHYVIDLRREYEEEIIEYFRREYLDGRTPNPCNQCNRKIKLGAFLEKVQKIHTFDLFATGHYAAIDKIEDGRYHLFKGWYQQKDQSYFMSLLEQRQLACLVFPLGRKTKVEVREIASKLGLPSAAAAESQDFYSGDPADLFLEKPLPGDIVDSQGRKIGRHKGLIYYTIGQRKGLGISAKEPCYVLGLDARENQVIVASNNELFRKGLVAEQINWISDAEIPKQAELLAKVRYRTKAAEASFEKCGDKQARIYFREAQRAISPGQIVAFYKGEEVLGGGIISAALEE